MGTCEILDENGKTLATFPVRRVDKPMIVPPTTAVGGQVIGGIERLKSLDFVATEKPPIGDVTRLKFQDKTHTCTVTSVQPAEEEGKWLVSVEVL